MVPGSRGQQVLHCSVLGPEELSSRDSRGDGGALPATPNPACCRRDSKPGAQPGSWDSGMGVTLAVRLWVQWAVLMLTAGFNTCKDGIM